MNKHWPRLGGVGIRLASIFKTGLTRGFRTGNISRVVFLALTSTGSLISSPAGPKGGCVCTTLKERLVPLDLVKCLVPYLEADLLTEWDPSVERADVLGRTGDGLLVHRSRDNQLSDEFPTFF